MSADKEIREHRVFAATISPIGEECLACDVGSVKWKVKPAEYTAAQDSIEFLNVVETYGYFRVNKSVNIDPPITTPAVVKLYPEVLF